jgi:3-oxoacyl-[acyl-carrier-protein] synthase-3
MVFPCREGRKVIGICEIASYIPEKRIDNVARKEMFGVSDTFIKEKIGILRVARKSPDEDTSDLCCRAFGELIKKINLDSREVEAVIVCTQNPDYNLPHVSAIIQGRIGLRDDCAAFDIALGCSGYVYALAVAESFMKSMGLKKGLLFTADPYSKIIEEEDKNTSLIFGDAATVTLIAEDPVYRSMKFSFGTQGRSYKNLICTDGRLQMNGREIFSFALRTIPSDVKHLLLKNGLSIKEIDLFLFHQGSKYIIDQLVKAIGIPKEKAPYVVGDYGNTVSSSIPLMLEGVFRENQVETLLISGFGVGLSWASGILKRTK